MAYYYSGSLYIRGLYDSREVLPMRGWGTTYLDEEVTLNQPPTFVPWGGGAEVNQRSRYRITYSGVPFAYPTPLFIINGDF